MLSTPKHLKRSTPMHFTEESMTEQHHADEVKIQNIMKKYKETGVINHVNKYQGSYQDMIDAPDFADAMYKIAEAKTMFESVPAHIRDDFHNDPQEFLAFIQDPSMRDAIEEYGLDASHLPPLEDNTPPKGTPAGNPKKASQASPSAQDNDDTSS